MITTSSKDIDIYHLNKATIRSIWFNNKIDEDQQNLSSGSYKNTWAGNSFTIKNYKPMKSIAQIHAENNHLISRTGFLKKEIDFLYKLLNQESRIGINNNKIEMLDGYRKLLDKCDQELNDVVNKIQQNEKDANVGYSTIYSDLNYVTMNEEKNIREVIDITKEVSTIKESILEYVQQCHKQL